MSTIIRISPQDARQKVSAGQALLVCAYADYTKFLKYRLKGAIFLSDLHAKQNRLNKDQEIIFYCN